VAFYRERIPAMGIDGVLAVLSWDLVSGDLVPALRARGVAVVGVGGSREVPEIDCFIADDRDAGRRVGRYLSALGHTQVAFLGPPDSEAAALRFQGLAETLAAQGAEPSAELVVQLQGHGEAEGYRGAEDLLGRNARFSALVAFNDLAALGALGALEDQGLRVPERVSVVGFGDTVSAFSRPKITTVSYPKEAMVRAALGRLLQRIEGAGDAPRVQRLPVALAIRESTRAI
jgi:LacI family transcriptional regulator